MKKSFLSSGRVSLGAALLLAILSLTYSCSKSSTDYTTTPPPGNKGGPGVNEVWIQGMAFTPATITVNANTTITWTNKDGVTHTVTSDTGLFNGNLSQNGVFTHTFTTPGSYPYHCSIHTYMTGTVIVQ